MGTALAVILNLNFLRKEAEMVTHLKRLRTLGVAAIATLEKKAG